VKASVILPVYNAARTLPRAIESILAQDVGDFELITIDDCSSDGSRVLIEQYAAADDRIRTIFHPENVGLPGTLNEALQAARGEYVVRMDADDESLPHRLSVQLDFMERHPRVAVAGSSVYHMGSRPEFDHLIELPTGPARVREMLRVENCIYHPSVIMRRAEVVELGGYRPGFQNAEDYDLWLRVAKLHELDNIAEPLLRYRFSVGGQTLARKWEQLFYFLLAQAANQDHASSFSEARRDAADALAKVNRRQFMSQTGRAAADELVRLHLWRDAYVVGWRLWSEAGPRPALAAAARVSIAALRAQVGRLARRSP
jgi:glycosyltransferase involved in cell wall biosynthesis